MNEKNPGTFEEHMLVYKSKSALVRKVFWDRIKHSVNLAQIKNDSVVLDIGCNTGHLLNTIRNTNSSCECWGIDVEPKITTLKIENCRFKVTDIKKTPFEDNYFSMIFALDILEHIKDLNDAIKEIHRVLKPDGVFILCGPTESWFYKLCRFLQFGVFAKNVECVKSGFRGEIDFHHHTIYAIEKKFQEHGFKKLKQKSIPGFPIPNLFRVTKFQNFED